ncbi:MAG: alpha/beta fold hydrolase [Pseudomonadota bacterium]
MAMLSFDDQNALFYLHTPPARDHAPTFVFVNALTGTTDHWEAEVAPALRDQGFGTLTYNFRGQAESTYKAGLELTPAVIVEDIVRLCAEVKPAKPVLVGLSIGGLFAAQAIRDGVDAAGLVYLNTLREIGPRIAWVNESLGMFASKTGVGVMMAATFPMLVNPEFLENAKPNMLPFQLSPLPDDHPHANLMRNSSAADWAFPWDSLTLPTLNITGHCDRVFLDVDVVDKWCSRMADVRRLDWDDCGHLIPLERPDRLAEALAEFGAELLG